jgi:hypothetical protein
MTKTMLEPNLASICKIPRLMLLIFQLQTDKMGQIYLISNQECLNPVRNLKRPIFSWLKTSSIIDAAHFLDQN